MPSTSTRSPALAVVWTALRFAMAVTVIAAVVAQLVKSVSTAAELHRDVPTTVANFFSFFTILSNVAASVVLLCAVGWFLARGRGEAVGEPRALAVALASVSTYMIVTGIVYNLLLRNIELPQGSQPIPWSNEVLHLVGPIFLLLDVLFAPRRRRLGWGTVAVVLVWPLVWVTYTLLRGENVVNPVTGEHWWYPYPFLNPHLGGWPSVWLYVVGIAVGLGAIAAGVIWIGRRRGRS